MKSTQGKRLTIEYVGWYVEKFGEGVKLVSKDYKNYKTNLDFKCVCGRNYKTTFASFKISKVKRCDLCKGRIEWDIGRIKKYVSKNGEGTILITDEYRKGDEKITYKCRYRSKNETKTTKIT